VGVAVMRVVRSSPYWPVVSHRILRGVLPGFAVSSLGDGMSIVAVTWLAMELVPSAERGAWVAIAVAAYTLPGAVGALLLSRFLRGRRPAQLASWDAVLRACALGAIPLTYAFGALSIGVYVSLLAVSSLLHAWGSAGCYTLFAQVLPVRHHLAGNAVLSTIGSFTTVAGPSLAGLLIGGAGAVSVIAVDAATFAVLAATFRFAIPAGGVADPVPRQEPFSKQDSYPDPAQGQARGGVSRAAGFGVIRHNRKLLGLLTLNFGFFFLFGPVYVALPLHVSQELHGSADLLAAFYSAFRAGAVLGALLTGYLSRWGLWPTTIGVVIAFGAAMLPVGLGASTVVALGSFVLAGLLSPPYLSMSMALFQRSAPTTLLPQMLTASASVRILSVPLGTALGGPLVGAFGPARTLQFSAVAILALGLATAGVMALRAWGKTGA
jgi:MFS family permease